MLVTRKPRVLGSGLATKVSVLKIRFEMYIAVKHNTYI